MIGQLAPFNENRLEACMVWIMRRFRRELSQYQILKLHFLTDFYHVLEHGTPAIGGTVEAWDKGPVVPAARRHIMDLAVHRSSSCNLTVRKAKAKYLFSESATTTFDPDDLSPSETKAMELAWADLRGHKGEGFFHDPDTFVGQAWLKAKLERGRNGLLDWETLVRAYDQLHHADHSHVIKSFELLRA